MTYSDCKLLSLFCRVWHFWTTKSAEANLNALTTQNDKIVFWFSGKLLLMPTLTCADLAYCQQCIGHMATRHKQWWYIYNDIIRSLTFNYWLDVFWSDACISLHNTLAMPIIRGCSMVELHLKLLKIAFIFFSQSLDMTSSW